MLRHPLEMVLASIVIVVCITALITKRPHKPWLKAALVAVLTSTGVWSVYSMAHENVYVAILFGATLAFLVIRKTIHKGWPEWWKKL